MGNTILIKAKINNSAKEYTFIFDTGASAVAVSKKVVDELINVENNSEIKATDAVNTSQKMKVISLKFLKVGDVEVQNCEVGVLDSDIFKSFGIKIDGLIGNNFLKFFLVKMDFEKKVLILSSMINNNVQFTQGYLVKLVLNDFGELFTLIKVGSIDSPALVKIDTGAGDYLTFPLKYLEKVKPELRCKLIKSNGVATSGLFGQSESIYSRLSSVELGSFIANNLPIQFSNSKNIYLTNTFLSHFEVIINYPKLEMYLVPDKNKPFKTNIESFGFIAKRDENDKVKIVGLWEDSPAKKGKLKKGKSYVTQGNDFIMG